MKFFVYILTNKHNKVLYTGVTDNLAKRLFEHQSKFYNGFTKRYNADKLIYYLEYNEADVASKREKQIKAWIRKKKIDLINSKNPGWNDMSFDVSQNENI